MAVDQFLTIPENGTPTAVLENRFLPAQFTLEQNYPNPFNPTTIIRYNLPGAQFVTLQVFDVLGRELVTLVNGEHAAGGHTITFDAARLSAGVLIYRLQAGRFSQTRKMILLR